MTDVEEFYDEASEEFPGIIDLVPGANNTIKGEVQGRLVAIWPLSNGTAKGDNGPYPYTETVTLVLDDGLNGDQFTDLVGNAPVELKLRHSTTGLASRLGPRLDGMTAPIRDADGTVLTPSRPQRFIPMIGRLNARPNTKQKNGSPPIGISKLTDGDKAICKANEAQIREISDRLKAKASEAETEAAFS